MKNVFTGFWLFTFSNNKIISKEADFLRSCVKCDYEKAHTVWDKWG